MTDLHQIFDSLIGYLVGMTLDRNYFEAFAREERAEVDPRGRPGPRFAGLGDSGLFALGAGEGRGAGGVTWRRATPRTS